MVNGIQMYMCSLLDNFCEQMKLLAMFWRWEIYRFNVLNIETHVQFAKQLLLSNEELSICQLNDFRFQSDLIPPLAPNEQIISSYANQTPMRPSSFVSHLFTIEHNINCEIKK